MRTHGRTVDHGKLRRVLAGHECRGSNGLHNELACELERRLWADYVNPTLNEAAVPVD